MDTIFYNGNIHTLAADQAVVQAVGVKNGNISRLGSDQELLSCNGPKTETIDLKGGSMFPGFMEAHNHVTIFGYLSEGLDLSAGNVRKMADVLSLVKAEAEKTPVGSWIMGSRYAEYFLAENRHPRKVDLDTVSPDHPVVLFHTSFHACTLNSMALDELGIDKATLSPQGGIIEKDAETGDPTGVLHDQAMLNVFYQLFYKDLQAMNLFERVDFCARATQKYAELGLVLAADALVVPQTLSIYQDTLQAGRLNVRIYTMNHAPAADALIEAQIKTGFGSDQLRIGSIKIFADGGMSNRTAAVGSPYLTPPYDRGLKIQECAALIEQVKRYHALGYQVAIHAQGDDGIRDSLDALEGVLGTSSANPLRHRIEHAGCLYPALLKRAAAMNIPIAVQPGFLGELGDGFIEAFGPELSNRLYPFQSMLQAGITIGGSSDCPVAELDPRKGLVGAVLRRTPSGKTLGSQEALTMDQALRIYTQGSAYLSFDEHHNGTIVAGKRADFTVMAADPREVDTEEVTDIPFTMTVVDGHITWSQ